MKRNKSGLKRNRQNKVRKLRNRILKSKVHTSFLMLQTAIEAKNKQDVDNILKTYISEVDVAVKKGILHTNNGARKKSRIIKKIRTVFNNEKQSA